MLQNIEHQSSALKHRYSFYQLFKDDASFRIEIPIIQRDYAQGRKDQEIVRNNFLEALYEYLDKNKPYRDLDFIYGTIIEAKEGVKFIPLDGQQRLTTLFLLHWYLANISGCYDDFCSDFMQEGVARFSYETRVSSSEFCTALVTKQHKLNFQQLTENSLSKTIQNQRWFFRRWLNDPTIASMLLMLEAIHHKFEKRPEFYQRLTQTPQIITFHFLNLGEFSLTDDLYIKMNARGKLLNDFENFKSQFEKEIENYTFNDGQYSLKYKNQEKKVSAVDYFKQKIDTDWLDFLWDMVNQRDITADRAAMNLIYHLIATYHYVNSHKKPETLHSFLIGSGGAYNACSFAQYSNGEYFSEELLLEIITMFDLITLGGEHRENQQKYAVLYDETVYKNFYFDRDKIFTDIISNKASYPDRLLFHAFYQGIRQHKDREEMFHWLRVIFNLVHNSIFDSPQSYQRGLKSITELAKKGTLILDLLKKGIGDIEAFTSLQKNEEEIKAWLMTTSAFWKENIVSVEQHPFFLGQIGFLLNFSGISDYYSQYKTTNWGDREKHYQNTFNQYRLGASRVFKLIEKSSQSIHYLWERAVLTKGFYLTKAQNSRYNLLSTRLSKNNIERDHSWKLLLRYHARTKQDVTLNPWFVQQSYIKAVLDDPCFNDQDDVSLEEGLQAICSQFLENHSHDDWRTLFIAEPKLFEVCEQGFVVIDPAPSLINEGEPYNQSLNYMMLFHQSQWNHYHSELYTQSLYYLLQQEIQEKVIDISPLDLKYEPQKSGEILPFLKFEYQDHILAITRKSGLYQLHYAPHMDEHHQDILQRLKDWENLSQEDHSIVYLKECRTIDFVLNEISNFSQIIRSIINE